MGLVCITPPTAPLITLAEAKARLRIDTDSTDSDLALIIKAVTAELDCGWLGMALVTQTWKFVIDEFPDGEIIRIPHPPLQGVNTVKYLDSAGVLQTLPSEQYRVVTDACPGYVELGYNYVWPSTRDISAAVEISFNAGYGDAGTDVDELIRAYAFLRLGHLYQYREAVITGTIVSEPEWVTSMLVSKRVMSVYP